MSLCDTNSARKLGLVTTGNAGGSYNLLIEHGDDDFPAMLRRMGSGIVVTERYDRVRLDSLKVAVARPDDGQPFKILSSPTDQANPVESLSSTHRITCRGGGTGRRTGLENSLRPLGDFGR